jgi:spore maturation protein CgeB
MNILVAVPANLRTVPMGRYVPDAAASLGHAVSVVDYSLTLGEKLRTRLLAERPPAEAVEARLLRAIEQARPQLFLTLYGANVSARVLGELRARGAVTANWWLNDPFQLERGATLLPAYDFAFTNARYSVEAYAARGVKNVRFLPTACEPSVHRPLGERAPACELSFAGDWSALREQLLGALVAQGIDLRVFGPWRRKLAPDSRLRARLEHGFFSPGRMAEIFAACKATLNIHTWRGRFDYGLNPRVFEAAACGVPQLVDHKRELDELFDEHERAALLIYRDDAELLGQARSISHRGAELRERALAASASIRERHSYLARVRELLRVVGAG